MRSLKGCFMLAVAFVLTLNNFFYAVNPAAAKPIFDWIDPFAGRRPRTRFHRENPRFDAGRNRMASARGDGPWWGRWFIYTPTITWRRWRAVDWRAGPCGWLWCRLRSPCSSMRAFF